MTSEKQPKQTKTVRKIPSPNMSSGTFVEVDSTHCLTFLLGVDTDQWKLESTKIGTENNVKVSHFFLKFIGDAGKCPSCGTERVFHDKKERTWRHSNMDDTVCYLHANIPRCSCPKCGKISQVDIPWADPNVSYTKRFMEMAVQLMSQMSILAASRQMVTTWRVLDGIVGSVVEKYLDRMDLSEVRNIRVDETSAKKHHHYITVVTDVDTETVIFITKGKDSNTMREFRDWLIDHNGDPASIELVATDFGRAFISGTEMFFPNAESVLDPFHLIQLANRALDSDRISGQKNGERLKAIRYSLLKKQDSLTAEEREILEGFTKDNEKVALSYQMKETLRDLFRYTKHELKLAEIHLNLTFRWMIKEGSKKFITLGKTIRDNLKGILRAIETGINNGYQEGLNGRIQLSKRLARGYHKEMRFGRMIYFRDLFRMY